jgi:hypothetical protein
MRTLLSSTYRAITRGCACPRISQQKRTRSRLLALASANRQMALPETAPSGRHMLHTMNSTNVMPISSTKKATESYSSQCRLTVIMSFVPALFPTCENRWARQNDLDIDQKYSARRLSQFLIMRIGLTAGNLVRFAFTLSPF